MKDLILKPVNPYSDNSLFYNTSTGKYELTLGYVNEQFTNTFRDEGTLQKRIRKNTRVVYSYLLSHCYTNNVAIVEKLLNYTMQGRAFLLDILTCQMEADLASGYNDLGITPAINVANMSKLERQDIKSNLLCVNAEQVMDRCQEYFGFNIFVMCPYSSETYLKLRSLLSQFGD